jgi:hypothetical protein
MQQGANSMQPNTHKDTEHAFHAALWASDLPAGLTAPDPSEVGQRFTVYRNNVQHSLTRALGATFPVIEKLVGHVFFAGLARAFIASAPPRDPILLHWGAEFPEFLQHFPPVSHLSYLADVARLEYARGRACNAADANPVSPNALTKCEADALRVVLHLSVTLFSSSTPAVQIWLAHQLDSARTPLKPGPDYALIARRPDFSVIVEPLDSGSYAVLSALHQGQTLGAAASCADPITALTLLLRHGLITAIGSEV